MDTPSKLPKGWFSPADIEIYRGMYNRIPDGGLAIEIGVYRGRSLMSVADIIRERCIGVMAIDSFDPLPEYGDSEANWNAFLEARQEFGVRDWITPFRMKSCEAAQQLNLQVDFVFIDGDHGYEAVKQDIELYEPKVKPGGWIGGHDYQNFDGVARAVNERFGSRVQVGLESLIWLVQAT